MSDNTPSVFDITNKTQEVFGTKPCKFQAQTCSLQLRGIHSVLVSPTGSGKSLSFLMPFIWQHSGVSILISPLQLLGSQHASHSTLQKLGIQAINLTSETASNQTFKDIASGKHQLVITSPEYVDEDPRFRKYLWDVPSFRKQVTRIIFDEAHCVLEWGDFRPAYRRLHYLVHLLRNATFLALSATLSPSMVNELQRVLNLYNMVVIRRSNDRPGVALIARPMKHSFASLHDTAFLVPLNHKPGSPPPPKFMLFMRTKKSCERAAKFLRNQLPPKERDRIEWVHAEMTRGFNERAMEKLRRRELYGVVCTDIAGMGIDIPDVDYVVLALAKSLEKCHVL